jgi:hypothetical protein
LAASYRVESGGIPGKRMARDRPSRLFPLCSAKTGFYAAMAGHGLARWPPAPAPRRADDDDSRCTRPKPAQHARAPLRLLRPSDMLRPAR